MLNGLNLIPSINDLPDDVICNIAIYADDTTFYSKSDQVSDLWQQIKLASEFESDLQVTEEWGRKWLIEFNAGKTQLIMFGCSNNTGAIDVEMKSHTPPFLIGLVKTESDFIVRSVETG